MSGPSSVGRVGADAHGAAVALSSAHFSRRPRRRRAIDRASLACQSSIEGRGARRLTGGAEAGLQNSVVTLQFGSEAAFEARAIAAETGWIETSLPGAAAGAVRAVEDLLSAGYDGRSVAIRHQLLASRRSSSAC